MTVYLCGDLGHRAGGLDLAALAGWLTERHPQTEVRVTPGPCDRPERWLDREGTRADRLLLGLCAADRDRAELHARARRLGFDPLAIEVVDLGATCALTPARAEATRKARALFAAALALSRAYRASGPENARPVFTWDQPVSRRSLFTLPPIRWEVVPSIRDEACAVGRGCRACATLCPHGALRAEGGRMVLSKTQCTGCGACVSTCPVAAIDLPGASLAQIEAQLDALLGSDAANGSRPGILFLCHRGAPALRRLPRPGAAHPIDWLPVELPCLAMVTPAWILQSLQLGAAAVGMLACRREECRFGQRETVEGRAGYCQATLAALDLSPDAVWVADVTDERGLAEALSRPVPSVPLPVGGGRAGVDLRVDHGATANALLGLARQHGRTPARALDHAQSPLGVVTLSPGCTVCGACASACPTAALALDQADAAVTLSFDGTRCTGCGGCVPVCPESVVHVDRHTDLAVLSRGQSVLRRDHVARCEKCGGAVATRALLDRFASILGRDPVMSTITRYCEACRGSLS